MKIVSSSSGSADTGLQVCHELLRKGLVGYQQAETFRDLESNAWRETDLESIGISHGDAEISVYEEGEPILVEILVSGIGLDDEKH